MGVQGQDAVYNPIHIWSYTLLRKSLAFVYECLYLEGPSSPFLLFIRWIWSSVYFLPPLKRGFNAVKPGLNFACRPYRQSGTRHHLYKILFCPLYNIINYYTSSNYSIVELELGQISTFRQIPEELLFTIWNRVRAAGISDITHSFGQWKCQWHLGVHIVP